MLTGIPPMRALGRKHLTYYLEPITAFLPPSELEWNVPEDYREEVTTMLSSARSLAVESIQKAQEVYKRYFDRKAKQQQFRVGDQVLIRFPSEEQGK